MTPRTEKLLIAGILLAGFVALCAAGPAGVIIGGDDIGGARKRRAIRRRLRSHPRPHPAVAAAVATVEAQPGPPPAPSSAPAEDDDGAEQ